MKKVRRVFQSIIVVLLAFTSSVLACDKSSLTLVSATSIGGGQYKIVVTVCSAKGTVTTAGNGSTSAWTLDLAGGGATIASFSPPTVTSSQTGSVYTGNITSPTKLTYSGPGFWSDICATCAPDGSVCATIAIITNSYPTTITANGLEGSGCPKTVNLPILAPITLLSFVGSTINETIQLKWATADEVNNNYFSIERSKDGYAFQEITRVTGAGNSSTTHQYTYTDINPFVGVNYYRFKQVDFNGLYSYSSIIGIKLNAKISALHIAPNPIKSGGLLQMNATLLAENSTCTVMLCALDGRLVYEQTVVTTTDGSQIWVPELAPGMYFLRVSSVENSLMQKVIVE